MIKETETDTSRESHQMTSLATDPPRILIAEDDEEMKKLLTRSLQKAGYEVITCLHGWDLLSRLSTLIITEGEKEEYSLIISDIRMPGVTGMEVLKGLSQIDLYPPMILITAFGDEKIHAEAEKHGAAALFDKPFDINDLIAVVRKIVPC